MISPNITDMMDLVIYANQIIGAPYPTFFSFGLVLAISLILTFSIAQAFRWERAIVVGGGVGLILTLTLAMAGPEVMNLYYAAIFAFMLVIGIFMTMREKDTG